MWSFGAYPPSSSSALPSSLSNITNAKRSLRALLNGRCHRILTSCNSLGSFSANSSSFIRHTDPSSGRHGNRDRHSSIVCKGYGDEQATSSDSSRYRRYTNEPSPARESYDATKAFDSASVGEGYGSSESHAREPTSVRRSFGTPESFGREPSLGRTYRDANGFNRGSDASSSYRSVTSLSRESPAPGSYSSPRRYVREYPARVDRLSEIVSSSYGGYGDSSSSAHAGLLSQEHSSRDLNISSFKNATVSVFWDLDNKPPTTSPYHAALFLRHAASQFGSVVEMVAYANHHAFTHVPNWVREQRRDRKQLDFLEQKGLVQPDKPYVCNLCGRKCKTNLLLKKHFKQLHEREHNKRMTRLNSLKGKKREKYRAATLPKTQRYKEAASPILVPKAGYGLESDLRRAGIFVKTVQYKPQAADIELKKQMADSMHKGVKCICLVSDDTDFSPMLADARALNLRTVVFGESRSLKRYADFWFPWEDISRGIPAQDFQEAIRAWAVYHNSVRQRDLEILAGVRRNDDSEVEHKVFGRSIPVQKARFSAFSEEEPSIEGDAYASASDDDAEWSFDDEEDELDIDWEDDVDDDEVV